MTFYVYKQSYSIICDINRQLCIMNGDLFIIYYVFDFLKIILCNLCTFLSNLLLLLNTINCLKRQNNLYSFRCLKISKILISVDLWQLVVKVKRHRVGQDMFIL